MVRLRPDLMQLADDDAGGSRVAGPRTDTTKAKQEDIDKALLDAAVELGLNDAQIEAGKTDPATFKKLPDESNTEFNKRVTQAYKDFSTTPELTPEEQAAGYTVKFVRTGAAGQGEYRKIRPLKFDVASANAAGTGNGFTFDEGDGTDSTDGVTGNKVYTASDGQTFTDQAAFVDYEVSLRETGNQARLLADQNKAERRSAYDLLLSEFKQYGLDALVTPLKSLIEEGVSPSEFTLRLRETDAYKKRFAANAQRVAKGLRALSEAEYIGTEDQYQDVMRRYGMPESYYTKGELGIQSGFEKFLAGDVSAVELEDRIQTAQNRVVNSNPEVAKALKEFYPGISNGDILAYVLDPTNAIEQIKRKVTAAEIGGAAIQSGLKTGMTRAEELAAAGITKQQAQQGFQTVAEVAPRGSQLAEIYGQSPYTQTTAEQEVFGLAGATEAAKQRKKLTSLETAAFSGTAGAGAIARERAGSF
jgi:hypothetical protein